jgi:hypothetical protein
LRDPDPIFFNLFLISVRTIAYQKKKNLLVSSIIHASRSPLHTHPLPTGADEIDQISTRTLALARYKRNHDWMNQVFYHAAFKPNHLQDPTTTTPYSIFNNAEMQGKVVCVVLYIVGFSLLYFFWL